MKECHGLDKRSSSVTSNMDMEVGVRDVTEPGEGGEGGLECHGCDRTCRRRKKRFKVSGM